MLGKKKSSAALPLMRDRVIIFDEEQRTCEILPITEENEEVVKTENKTIPKPDLTLTLSKSGKVYVLRAPSKIVELTEHLAKVEQNTIWRQLAQYTKPFEEMNKPNIMQYVLIGYSFLVTIFAIMKH
jgi:hypothetical protein